MSGARRDRGAERHQEHLVEAYLERHPWSTYPEIRDGVEREEGVRIERVQRCVGEIRGWREVHDRVVDERTGTKAFALGEVRSREAWSHGVKVQYFPGRGFVVEVMGTSPDREAAEALASKIRRALGLPDPGEGAARVALAKARRDEVREQRRGNRYRDERGRWVDPVVDDLFAPAVEPDPEPPPEDPIAWLDRALAGLA